MPKPNKLQVEGRPDLVRDTRSSAILQTDLSKKQRFMAKRDAQSKRLNSMERDIDHIKKLLTILIEKQS